MPELPEVHTTAQILNKLAKGRTIIDVWTDYDSAYYYGKLNIKDPKYFKYFRNNIRDQKIIKVWRRAKNVLIKLGNEQVISVHMKMTGQLLYGKYTKMNQEMENSFMWKASTKGPLQNPFSRFIHLVFILDNGMHIAFSDMRKFATIKLLENKVQLVKEFEKIGPEPLEKNFNLKKFKERMLAVNNSLVKTALMNPAVIAGVGNIYSDEILFASKILPYREVSTLSDSDFSLIFKNLKKILLKGINLGGDSMSDYRNPYGEKGHFQLHHKVYGRKNENCMTKNCKDIIERKMIGGRSAHFCPNCQK